MIDQLVPSTLCDGEYPLSSNAKLQAQVTAAVSHTIRCAWSGTELMLNSSVLRLACVLRAPSCRHRQRFAVERALSSSSCLKLTFELSSLMIKSVCEAHQTEQCSVGRNDPTQIWGCLRGAAMTTPNVPAGWRCPG